MIHIAGHGLRLHSRCVCGRSEELQDLSSDGRLDVNSVQITRRCWTPNPHDWEHCNINTNITYMTTVTSGSIESRRCKHSVTDSLCGNACWHVTSVLIAVAIPAPFQLYVDRVKGLPAFHGMAFSVYPRESVGFFCCRNTCTSRNVVQCVMPTLVRPGARLHTPSFHFVRLKRRPGPGLFVIILNVSLFTYSHVPTWCTKWLALLISDICMVTLVKRFTKQQCDCKRNET